jgi:Xaa-Pro aminopeptidase
MSLLERSTWSPVPAGEVPARIARLQTALAAADLPLAIITHRIDLFYLSGTMPDGWLLVPAEGEPTLLARKSFERARRESPLANVEPFSGARGLTSLIEASGGAHGRIGLDLDVVPAALYLKLAGLLPNAAWVDVAALVRGVRAVKSPWEIKQHRLAAAQHRATFDAVREFLPRATTELDLSAHAEGVMRRQGHQGLVHFRRTGMDLWFLVTSSGWGAAYPTAFDGPVGSDGMHPAAGLVAGHRPITRGVPVMVDAVANHFGYHADIARTFCLGEPPDAIKRAHDFCVRTLREVERRLRPGALWGDVFQEVAAWAEAAGEPVGFMGFGENRVKFFGHGVGLEVDELPILAKGFRQPLEAGMIIAVEPKAFDPELGPAGLEMTYLLTDDGPEPLLDYPENILVG